MGLFLQLLINGLINGAMFSILAISFGFVYRTTKIFHIAFAGIFTSSSYFFYTFFIVLKFSIFLSIFLSSIFAGILGILIEKAIYFQFSKKNASNGVILIASLGTYITIVSTIALIFGSDKKIFLSEVQPSYSFFSIILAKIQIIMLLTGILLISIITIFLVKFKVLKIFWAIGDEPMLVSALGIPVYKLKAYLFFFTSFIIAIPSCLIGLDIGIEPYQGMHYFLIAFVAVLFGGVDNYKGWLSGSFLLSVIQSLFLLKFHKGIIDLISFLILILVLLFRPQGLFGLKKRMEEF